MPAPAQAADRGPPAVDVLADEMQTGRVEHRPPAKRLPTASRLSLPEPKQNGLVASHTSAEFPTHWQKLDQWLP
jgi:hypothetical protein